MEDTSERGLKDYLDQYAGLAREYIEKLLEDPKFQEHDRKYGVRYDPVSGKFSIGNGQIDFTDDEKILVFGAKYRKIYKGTRGLLELLFKSEPKRHTQQDERNYKEIVHLTSAHRRNYDPTQQIVGNSGRKYKGIIKPMLKAKIWKRCS